MSIGLLLPLGLAALAAFIVPLLIHLVRRPEQTPYDFPALRWLSESARPRRRPRLDDLVLLFLRLLLLALMALLLAEPVLHGEWRGARHWILASSTIDLDAASNSASDKQAEWRWLAPGFPEIDGNRPALEQATSSLVREFESSLPASDTISVLMPAEPDGFDAERIALGRSVEWIEVPAPKHADSRPAESRPLKVSLRHANADQRAARYLRAALAALQAAEPGHWQIDDAPASTPVGASSNTLIWLDGKLPEEMRSWVAAGGRALVLDPQAQSGSIVLRDSRGDAVVREVTAGKGEIVQFLRPLNPDDLPMLLDAGFPGHLRVLLEGTAAPPTRAFAAEVEPRLVERTARPPTTSLAGLLCLLIAIVFLFERTMAMRRRRLP